MHGGGIAFALGGPSLRPRAHRGVEWSVIRAVGALRVSPFARRLRFGKGELRDAGVKQFTLAFVACEC